MPDIFDIMDTHARIASIDIHTETEKKRAMLLEDNILLASDWNTITPESYHLYMRYYFKTLQKASEYSFLGVYIWKDLYGLQYIANEEVLFLRTKEQGVYWAPLGDWNTIDWDYYALPQIHATFQYVPEALVSIWQSHYKDAIHVMEDRDSWDYIYRASDLAELVGRKYAKKKNHLNSFLRTTPEYSIKEITAESAPHVLATYMDWAKEQEEAFTPLLQAEYVAICDILTTWSSFVEIQGIYITINHDVVAFAIGEALSSTSFVIQIEKGLQDIRGLYQVINKSFAEKIYEQGYTYINRADDSGIAGLRKAKESYYPLEYSKKYTVQFI